MLVNTLSRTRVLEICVTVGCRECEKRQKQPCGGGGTRCPQGWDKLLTALRGQTHHMGYAVPVARGLQAYSVHQDIPDLTFYLGVLTQPPHVLISPHILRRCQEASGQLLSLPHTSLNVHLGAEGEGQVGHVSRKQSDFSQRPWHVLSALPSPVCSQPEPSEAGSPTSLRMSMLRLKQRQEAGD